eukprot:6155853-Prymnesium_polylepis.1
MAVRARGISAAALTSGPPPCPSSSRGSNVKRKTSENVSGSMFGKLQPSFPGAPDLTRPPAGPQ